MGRDFILALVRHALTGVGSVVAAKGYADGATVEAIIGGVVAAVAVALSWRDKAVRAA